MAKFKKGDAVQQVMPAPVKGTVTGFSVDDNTGDLIVNVAWTEVNGEGVAHDCGRGFTEEQLEVQSPI